MKSTYFDERQIQLRGQIFLHGYVLALTLILLNAFLQDNGIVWADPFYQNLLIFVASITLVSIEFIVRGVYFGQRKTPWPQIYLFGALSLVLTFFCLNDLIQGAALVENTGLSDRGAVLVFDAMFIATALVALIHTVRERRKNKD